MKKWMVLILLISVFLTLPLILAQEQAKTYSGFNKFVDNTKLFFSSGDKKVMLALEVREKEINSAMNNLELGKEDKAKKEIKSATNMLKIIQLKTSPEIVEEVKSNLEGTEFKIKESENLNLEFFEKYLIEEQKTKLVVEHSEKTFNYCEELAKQDYELMLEDEKCKDNNYAWLGNKVENEIKKIQEQDSEKIQEQVEISMNNPKNADCDEISLTSERKKCEKFKSLAIKCEFQDDESACKEIRMFKDVQTNNRENYEQEILEKYVPAECIEAGIQNGEECKKYIVALYQPDSECIENGEVLDDEACGKKLISEDKIPKECIENGQPISPEECERIMKEKSEISPDEVQVNLKECVNAGYNTKEECGNFMLKQNLPQECVDAGALTPEACEKLKLPQKCQGQAFSNEECEAVFIKEKMPAECQESGTYNFFKCAKLLYSKVSDISIGGEVEYLEGLGISVGEIPDECFKDSSRTIFERDMDCDEALIKEFGIMLPPPVETSNIPPECMKAGTPVSPEECQEILNGGIIQNDLKDIIPAICQEANVKNPEECGRLLDDQRKDQGIGINMPEECIGLDVEECKKIMQDKGIDIKKPEVNQMDDDMCEEGEEDCNDDIITTGVPDECAKLGVYDKESCSIIMSKINAQRIKDGDKIVINDDGNTDIITNDQINQIIGDANKKSDDIEPDITKANEIKQQIDVIDKSIDKIDKVLTVDKKIDKGGNIIKDSGGSTGGDNVFDDDLAPGPQGIIGNQGSGDDSGDSSPVDSAPVDAAPVDSSPPVDVAPVDSAPMTGETIKDSNSNNFIKKIFNWLF